jgi:hypothetical protein
VLELGIILQHILLGFYIIILYTNNLLPKVKQPRTVKASVHVYTHTCLLHFSSSSLALMLVCPFLIWEADDEPSSSHRSDKLTRSDVPELEKSLT